MTLKEKLKLLLEERGRGAKADLAKHLGISPVYVTRYADDKYDDVNMPSKYFTKTAIFFGLDANYFLDSSVTERLSVQKVPIIGSSSCGSPLTDDNQSVEGYVYYRGEYWTDKLYCVIAVGDSMAPEIEDGDEVICDPEATLINGCMVHYTVNNESAIKIYVKDESAFVVHFIPYNKSEQFAVKTIRLDDDSLSVKVARVVSINKLKLNNNLSRLKAIGWA
jgi:SOS-response transcriptional repressor LexA